MLIRGIKNLRAYVFNVENALRKTPKRKSRPDEKSQTNTVKNPNSDLGPVGELFARMEIEITGITSQDARLEPARTKEPELELKTLKEDTSLFHLLKASERLSDSMDIQIATLCAQGNQASNHENLETLEAICQEIELLCQLRDRLNAMHREVKCILSYLDNNLPPSPQDCYFKLDLPENEGSEWTVFMNNFLQSLSSSIDQLSLNAAKLLISKDFDTVIDIAVVCSQLKSFIEDIAKIRPSHNQIARSEQSRLS